MFEIGPVGSVFNFLNKLIYVALGFGSQTCMRKQINTNPRNETVLREPRTKFTICEGGSGTS